MLQFTQKQGRVKRKALLLTGAGGIDFDAIKNEVPVEEPQPLPGDAFERMKADPELIAFKKRFAWSVAAVVALVIAATIINLNRDKLFSEPPKRVLAPAVSQSNAEPAPDMSRDTRIASAARPLTKPETLDFTQVKPDDARPAMKIPSLSAAQPRPVSGSAARNPVPGYSVRAPGIAGSTNQGIDAGRRSSNAVPGVPRSLLRVARSKGEVLIQHDLTKAKAALTGFLKAASASERLQFVADRQSVDPRLRSYEERFGQAAYSHNAITDSVVVGNGGTSEHDVVMVDRRIHRASVVKADDGSFLVDWPSFVGEGDLLWEDFLERKVSSPILLRVTAELGDHYSGDFVDSKWLLCVKLNHPLRSGLPPLYAYAERKSVLGREVDYWLREGGGQVVPMTVRVKFNSIKPSADQVSLTEFVSPGWLLRGDQSVVDARGVTGN